jgi:hypothetical protein
VEISNFTLCRTFGSLQTFFVVGAGGASVIGILKVEGCVEHPPMHRTAPHNNKKLSAVTLPISCMGNWKYFSSHPHFILSY